MIPTKILKEPERRVKPGSQKRSIVVITTDKGEFGLRELARLVGLSPSGLDSRIKGDRWKRPNVLNSDYLIAEDCGNEEYRKLSNKPRWRKI